MSKLETLYLFLDFADFELDLDKELSLEHTQPPYWIFHAHWFQTVATTDLNSSSTNIIVISKSHPQ